MNVRSVFYSLIFIFELFNVCSDFNQTLTNASLKANPASRSATILMEVTVVHVEKDSL